VHRFVFWILNVLKFKKNLLQGSKIEIKTQLSQCRPQIEGADI